MNNIPYLLSKDYEKLYDIVSNGGIAAGFTKYSGSTLKDVVKITASKIKQFGYNIGCRGIQYGGTNTDNIDEFVSMCEQCDLEYIEPAEVQKARIKELEDAIRVEQSGLASALAEINKAADGWHWVTEGRGPYPYNDDRYKQETGWMIDAIKTIATKALNRAGIDATNVINRVPKYTIEEVRVAILQHWKKEFGSLDEEKEDESGAIRGPYFVSGFVLAAMESIGK